MINDQSSVINGFPHSVINFLKYIKKHTRLQQIKKKERKKYPQRHEKKGKLRKVSKWHQKVKKNERKKLSPEERKKGERLNFSEWRQKVKKKERNKLSLEEHKKRGALNVSEWRQKVKSQMGGKVNAPRPPPPPPFTKVTSPNKIIPARP